MTQLLHTWSEEQALSIGLSYLSDFMHTVQIELISHTGKASFSDSLGAKFCSSVLVLRAME